MTPLKQEQVSANGVRKLIQRESIFLFPIDRYLFMFQA